MTLRGARSSRGGFSLIELIVVIALLAVIAGAVMPRLLVGDDRRAEAAAKNIAALLSTAAHRDAVGADRMAIIYTPPTSAAPATVALETLRRSEEGGAAEWKRDRFARPIEMGPIRLREARIDGRAPAGSDWRVDFVPGEQRPTLELVVETATGDGGTGGTGGGSAWLIELLPYATAAEISRAARGGAATGRAVRSIDLDASGQGTTVW